MRRSRTIKTGPARQPRASSPAAAPPAKLIVNVFPGGFNWPCFVAQEKGFFASNGIEVTLQPTPNSVAQMTGLSEGRFDIAMTALDNIVAYVEGQGEAPIGAQPEFFAFMGSDTGFLSLVTRPGITRFSDLKGKTLSVDAKTTGYAFVLFDLLRRGGLADNDYEIVKVGGMTQRWEALCAGKQDGTLLSTPFDLMAKERGLNRLAWATKMIGPYQGNVAAANRTWAKAHSKEVVGFIRAYMAGIGWLHDKANRQDAVRVLTNKLPQMPTQLAQQSYDVLLDSKNGFFHDGKVDLEGVKTVLELRRRYGERKDMIADPMKYYDPTYHKIATAR
jgi:ABC-type nitrate/sulfonate/bicarbonate transport system substrate-binding protein